MPTISDVEKLLAPLGIRVLKFSEHTPDSESAARAVGCSVAEIVKSIVVNIGRQPVLVVTCGDVRINSSRLKRAAGISGKVRFASPNEVVRYTGYSPGGVSPFLLPAELPVLIDSSMRRFPIVYPAAGDDYSAVPVTLDQLLLLTKGTEVDVCELHCS